MAISMTKPLTSTHTTLIDEALPVYEFSDVNTIVVRATPQSIMQAYADVTLGEMTLLRPLFSLRALPARLTGHTSTTEMPVDIPFSYWSLGPESPWIKLGEDEHEVVIGAIGNFAQPNIEFVPVASAGQFLEFDDSSYAKTVLGVRIVPGGNPFSGYTLVAESRTHVPEQAHPRRFGLYWHFVRPFEALMVRGALSATKRRAEGYDETPTSHHTVRKVATSVGISLGASLLVSRLRLRSTKPTHVERPFTRFSRYAPLVGRARSKRLQTMQVRSPFRNLTALIQINNFNGVRPNRRALKLWRSR